MTCASASGQDRGQPDGGPARDPARRNGHAAPARLLGRARALEVILAGDDLDAETAERWGYLNRTFAADEIGPFVDRLARRIASFPADAIGAAKASVAAAEKPLEEGLLDEAYLFTDRAPQPGRAGEHAPLPQARRPDRRGELRMGELCVELGRG